MRKDHELYEAIIAFVMGGKQATVSDVVAALGDGVSAAKAVRELLSWAGRIHLKYVMSMDIATRVARGKYRLIHHKITKAVLKGRLRRISPGVYGPPLPRVYAPEVRVS